MSANISSMMFVKEVPWHGLGVKYEVAPKTSQAIIEGADLGYTVDTTPMYTQLHSSVPNYRAVYRQDTNDILGVINKSRPQIVQNTEMFKAIESLMESNAITVDTAASLGRGETVFGCFKVSQDFKVLDDQIDHYFVILNEHLKADGKVTILNTPIRVVCQNTLAAALSNNLYKVRVPVTSNLSTNAEIASKVFNSASDSVSYLKAKAEKMVSQKVTREYVETLMDVLFPFVKTDDAITESKANMNMQMMRDTFIADCMGADDLANYRGTRYQIFNALTDFSQHAYKNMDKAYDLNYRMSLLPGMGVDNPSKLVSTFLKIQDKIAA